MVKCRYKNREEKKKERKRKKMSNYDTYLQVGNPNEDTEYTGRYWDDLSHEEKEEYCQDGEMPVASYGLKYDSEEEQDKRMADAAWEAANDTPNPID